MYPAGHFGFVDLTVLASFPFTQVIVFLITPAPMVKPSAVEVGDADAVGVRTGAGLGSADLVLFGEGARYPSSLPS